MLIVKMADGSDYVINRLFGRPSSNYKLAKSNNSGVGYLTIGLSLAPHKMSGKNVCPFATDGCKASCIVSSGFGMIFPNVNKGRIARTIAFHEHRTAFMDMLYKEIRQARKLAEKQGVKLAVRLNVFSDIPWEKIDRNLFDVFSDVQFYDYTKNPYRMGYFLLKNMCNFPVNYHLTFSRSEENEIDCLNYLERGGNVAIPFGIKKREELPVQYKGIPVLNGDETDLRFLDKKGYWIGLRTKGKGRKDKTGFVVRL